MKDDNKKIKQKRMITYFINATTEIFQEDVNKLTIRNIADKAGFNSATLYNYFKNLDELINFTLISFMSKIWLYSVDEQNNDALISYLKLWEAKCFYVFNNTALYNYFLQLDDYQKQEFYHSANQYFEIFDDEFEKIKSNGLFNDLIQIDEFDVKRNRYLQPCIEEGYFDKNTSIISIADVIFNGIVYEITFNRQKQFDLQYYTQLFFKILGGYLEERLLKKHDVLKQFMSTISSDH